MKQPSALIFLDQNNIFFRFKKLDFKSLLEQLKKEFEVIKATSYMAVDTKQEAQRKFIIYMANNGWRCNTVDISSNTNIDVTLAADMINDHLNLGTDWIVLVSGDGDYSYPLHMLSTKGAKIMVIGAKDNISLELLKVADRIKYIEEFPGVILERHNTDSGQE
jgi:uncharacterized LabA/DUF88 family protein